MLEWALAEHFSSDGSGIWVIRQSERCEIGGRPLERRACQPCSSPSLVHRGAPWRSGSNYAPSPMLLLQVRCTGMLTPRDGNLR